MADAPLDRLVLGDFRPQYIRQLNYEYHAEMTAENTEQLVHLQRRCFELQAKHALSNIGAVTSIASQQFQTNQTLSNLSTRISSIDVGVGQIASRVSDLNLSVNSGFQELSIQLDAIQESLEVIAKTLFEQKQIMERIGQTLENPYETKAKELRREATKWLQKGMRSTGRDQTENYKDAFRLLKSCIENPRGRQDAMVWFQTGWISWKSNGSFEDASEAFYHAQRLSKDDHEQLYLKSVRHWAYMEYLQGNFEKAFQIIVNVFPDDGSKNYEIIFDYARYCAKTGRSNKCLEALDYCIDLRPQTIVSMFAEEDFKKLP